MTIQKYAASFEAALRLCASREDVRILRRVRSISELVTEGPPIGRTRPIAIVDTETTSVDVQTAEVIEIAAAMVLIDEPGETPRCQQTPMMWAETAEWRTTWRTTFRSVANGPSSPPDARLLSGLMPPAQFASAAFSVKLRPPMGHLAVWQKCSRASRARKEKRG